jgi:uncharacterized protein YkwD
MKKTKKLLFPLCFLTVFFLGIIQVFAQQTPKKTEPVLLAEYGKVGNQTANKSTSKVTFTVNDYEKKAFSLINQKRADNGLKPLVWDDTAFSLARTHSENMATNNFFSHKDLQGLTVDGRAESLGLLDYEEIGENIAFNQGLANPLEAAVEQWFSSPNHKKNLMGTGWTFSAIGISVTSDGKYYITQVFVMK